MFSKLFGRTYVTLNISANDVRAFSVRGSSVQKWGKTPLAPGLVKDGLILQPKAVGEAIKLLFEARKLSKKRVIVSVTGMSFTYRSFSIPKVEPELVEEAVKRGAKHEMPIPVEELYLSWKAIGEGDGEQEYFVLGVPKNLVDAVGEALVVAGIKPYIMEMKPLALARTSVQNDSIVVAMEPDCFDIVLTVNGSTEVMHSVTPRDGGASIQDHVRQLTDELARTVKYYNSGHTESPLSSSVPLMLTGQLAADTTTGELVQAEVENPVRPLVPPLNFKPELPLALYSTNMGLALHKTRATHTNGFHDIKLNVFAGTYGARKIKISRKQLFIYLGLALVGALLVPFYQIKSDAANETATLKSELNTMSQELHLAELASIRANKDAEMAETTIGKMTAELEALQQEHNTLLAGGGNFAGNLNLVTDIMPAATSFQQIDISTNTISIEGVTGTPFLVLDYAKALEAEEFAGTRVVEIGDITNEEGETISVYFTIEITR